MCTTKQGARSDRYRRAEMNRRGIVAAAAMSAFWLSAFGCSSSTQTGDGPQAPPSVPSGFPSTVADSVTAVLPTPPTTAVPATTVPSTDPSYMSPPPTAPYFPPDQALSWLNMGVIGNPNSLPGRYYFDSTILVNRSTYDIEVVDMSLGPPDEGEQSGVAYYWYESALHPLIASGPVPDLFPTTSAASTAPRWCSTRSTRPGGRSSNPKVIPARARSSSRSTTAEGNASYSARSL